MSRWIHQGNHVIDGPGADGNSGRSPREWKAFQDIGKRRLYARTPQRTQLTCSITHPAPISADVEQIWPGGRYGLGLVRRPLPCGGVRWGHDGGDGGYITVTGVTDDGPASAMVSMSTVLGDSLDHLLQQQRAADTLIDNALCGRR